MGHKSQCISKTVWYLDFYRNSFINLRNPHLCVVSRSRCLDLLLMCWPWQVESPWCWWSAQNAETCTLDIGRLSPGPAELHSQRSSHAASCTGWRRFDGGACRYWLWTMTMELRTEQWQCRNTVYWRLVLWVDNTEVKPSCCVLRIQDQHQLLELNSSHKHYV